MARYEVRLEAQDDSGHFRVTRLDAASKEEAKRTCERRELELVLYEITADEEKALLERAADAGVKAKSIADLPRPAALDATDEEKAAFRALDGADRARLNAHHQEKPYEVVSVTEVKTGG